MRQEGSMDDMLSRGGAGAASWALSLPNGLCGERIENVGDKRASAPVEIDADVLLVSTRQGPYTQAYDGFQSSFMETAS
jgi:hypothetical protein